MSEQAIVFAVGFPRRFWTLQMIWARAMFDISSIRRQTRAVLWRDGTNRVSYVILLLLQNDIIQQNNWEHFDCSMNSSCLFLLSVWVLFLINPTRSEVKCIGFFFCELPHAHMRPIQCDDRSTRILSYFSLILMYISCLMPFRMQHILCNETFFFNRCCCCCWTNELYDFFLGCLILKLVV